MEMRNIEADIEEIEKRIKVAHANQKNGRSYWFRWASYWKLKYFFFSIHRVVHFGKDSWLKKCVFTKTACDAYRHTLTVGEGDIFRIPP